MHNTVDGMIADADHFVTLAKNPDDWANYVTAAPGLVALYRLAFAGCDYDDGAFGPAVDHIAAAMKSVGLDPDRVSIPAAS